MGSRTRVYESHPRITTSPSARLSTTLVADRDLQWYETNSISLITDMRLQRQHGIGEQAESGGRSIRRSSFMFEYHDGDSWKSVPGADVEGNLLVDWHIRFESISTARVRLTVRQTPGQVSRIWEVELYQPATH